MPNHVINILKVSGEDKDKFLKTIKKDDDPIDFNNLIPQPECIKLPHNLDGIDQDLIDGAENFMLYLGHEVKNYDNKILAHDHISYNRMNKRKKILNDQSFEVFKQLCKAIMETGYSNWHPWNINHWGVKWNAYNSVRIGDKIYFQTAWNIPSLIYQEIAEKFPDVIIDGKYANEDIGRNCGRFTIKDGVFKLKPYDVMKTSKRFANKVWNEYYATKKY